MPSYRLILSVANLLGDVSPEQILPRSADALRKHVNVESFDLRITRGVPQLILRFTADDPVHARTASAQAHNEISSFIEVTRAQTLQRVHGRWEYI
ncbi:hypothetical protein ACFSYH_03165 [Populibacterium corticicola]|jgi:hypothetical protein|uniref:Uncharacterized protein n=1 Tax=Populibacterium corticicola TaxID=1812826 RepID=A0ABW5XDT4_9MICO